MDETERCPRCHSDEVLPIVYGLPGPELAEESMKGRLVLGGCMVWPESPDRQCAACHHSWRT